jgi:tRNA G46 methylase TrmB
MLDNIDSRGLVSSSQAGIHPRLEQSLRRHLAKPWSQPFHQPSVTAYRRLRSESGFSGDQPFVLDSGCGTGRSTRYLADLYPEQLVIGVDQSEARLAKSGMKHGIVHEQNWILLRAELATFWRLLLCDGLIPSSHLLLYPNPWPKADHMKRRWHGHPVFPVLLSLGGDIEMRCNWQIYAEEFAFAVRLATGKSIGVELFQPAGISVKGVSPFEQKYLARGQDLYSVTVPDKVSRAFRKSWLHS